MAKTAEITIGNNVIAVVDADPTAGGGLAGRDGDVAIFGGTMYQKDTGGATVWNLFSGGAPDVGSVTGVLGVANGGTGQSSYTNGQLLIGNTSGGLLNKATLTQGTNITITNGTGSITIAADEADLASATGTLPVDHGGTGQTSYTNGQLLIGNTSGNTLAKATLTAGAGVSVTNGTGTITIASTIPSIFVGFTTTTTDDTPTTLASLPTSTGDAGLLKLKLAAKRTGGTSGSAGDGAAYELSFRVKNVAGTLTISDLQSDYTSEDQVGWSITPTVNSTAIDLVIVGAIDNNISWSAELNGFFL